MIALYVTGAALAGIWFGFLWGKAYMLRLLQAQKEKK